MVASSINQAEYLRSLCKLSGARWAVWICLDEAGIEFGLRYGLSNTRLVVLEKFLKEGAAPAWLAGVFSSRRLRSRQTGHYRDSLGCQRLYIFPDVREQRCLAVGAEKLDKTTEGYLKIFAMHCAASEPSQENALQQGKDPLLEAFPYLKPHSPSLDISYEPEGILANVLEFLVSSLICDAGLLSIRSGDRFQIEASWNCDRLKLPQSQSIRDNNLLANMTLTRQGSIMEPGKIPPGDLDLLCFGKELGEKSRSWMGIPVVIGRRVIGHLAFLSFKAGAFQEADLQRIQSQAGRLAYVIENAIVFTETARYLQQYALLNELATAVSMSANTNDVADRVLKRLFKIFEVEKAGIYIISAEGKTVRRYGVDGEEEIVDRLLEGSQLAEVVKTGLPVRAGGRGARKGNDSAGRELGEVVSDMLVPLKYRGRVIGAIGITSPSSSGFTKQNEQLLSLIAGHLAGLFENIRLSEEMRQRAHNLDLIHQVVSNVVGLNDAAEIAKVSAGLMVERFDYDLAAVILQDEDVSSFVVDGPSGMVASTIRGGSQSMEIGVSRIVLNDGCSRLNNDTNIKSGGVDISYWQAGSEMCVALKDGNKILGTLEAARRKKYAFSENDLITLEALAGVLASVVMSARQYRLLQESVRQLQAVRETALDIARDLDLQALLKRVVLRARELVGAQGAELGLIDDKEQLVKILVSETPWYATENECIPFMAGVAGRVAVFGEPLVIPNYNDWNGRLYPERKAPYKSIAGIPLKFQGKVMGTLTLMDNRPDWEFTAQHIYQLELLAPQATIWIRNARLYQELQERSEAQHLAESRLVRSERLAAVGEMAAGVAHELNNPLTIVSGFTELVLDELAVDSPHRQDLELVLKEANRARGVVRQMLDFSRPGENRRLRTGINEVVRDVASLVHHMARTGGVVVEADLDDSLPWVLVDPSQIKQVLLNLMHNAIQAMPTGGNMCIQTSLQEFGPGSEPGPWVLITIEDTGEGISTENMERIFEPFFTTRPAGRGTGLGLSVSYGIVKEHGGDIEVTSQPLRGSCFRIFLPVAEEANLA